MDIRYRGTSGYRLLIACLDESFGGLYAYDGEIVERVDWLPSMSVSWSGSVLYRLPYSSLADFSGLFSYDEWGLQAYRRLPGLADAHHVVKHGREVLVASTSTNSLVWITEANGRRREWRAEGDGDCWHVNSAFLKDGKAYASAFGRFRTLREWNDHKGEGTGIVFDVDTGEDILTGLQCPHHPRFFDNSWAVCNSYDHTVVRFPDQSQTPDACVDLGGWTRGLAESDDYIFVGISAPRHAVDGTRHLGRVAILCRKTWRLLDTLEIGGCEIGDLAIAPRSLVDGVKRGFAVRSVSPMLPLPLITPDDIGIRVLAGPDRCAPNESFSCKLELENRTQYVLKSDLPHPVVISYRWVEGCSERIVNDDGLRTVLAPPLLQGSTEIYDVRVQAPPEPGDYRLRLTLVQEAVRWLDVEPESVYTDISLQIP